MKRKSNRTPRVKDTVYGFHSLYTWIHHNVVLPNKENTDPIKSIKAVREDGVIIDRWVHVKPGTEIDPDTLRSRRNYMGSEFGQLAKNARYHQSILVTITKDSGETNYYLFSRRDDVTYNHPVKGEQVKHNVFVSHIEPDDIKEWQMHFWVTPFVNDVIKYPLLTSVLSNHCPCDEKVEKIAKLHGKDSKEYNEVKAGVESYNNFYTYWNLIETEDRERLQSFEERFHNRVFLEDKPLYHVDENLNLHINTDSRLAQLGNVLGATEIVVYLNDVVDNELEELITDEVVEEPSEKKLVSSFKSGEIRHNNQQEEEMAKSDLLPYVTAGVNYTRNDDGSYSVTSTDFPDYDFTPIPHEKALRALINQLFGLSYYREIGREEFIDDYVRILNREDEYADAYYSDTDLLMQSIDKFNNDPSLSLEKLLMSMMLRNSGLIYKDGVIEYFVSIYGKVYEHVVNEVQDGQIKLAKGEANCVYDEYFGKRILTPVVWDEDKEAWVDNKDMVIGNHPARYEEIYAFSSEEQKAKFFQKISKHIEKVKEEVKHEFIDVSEDDKLREVEDWINDIDNQATKGSRRYPKKSSKG